MVGCCKIVLVEDDPLQAEWMAEKIIWDAFPDAELRYYDSEHSFLEVIQNGELQAWEPDHAIIDLLIRYYSPTDLEGLKQTPEFGDLPDVVEAGLRCRCALVDALPETRVAIATVLDTATAVRDVPEGCVLLQKGSDELSGELIEFLGK